MPLRPKGSTEIPGETARPRAAFLKSCLAMRVRDALGALFTDEQFAELFAARGPLDWKIALGLELTDAGFARGCWPMARPGGYWS